MTIESAGAMRAQPLFARRNLAWLAIVLCLTLSGAAFADQRQTRPLDFSQPAPLKQAPKPASRCAEFGAGFAPMPGSGTCMRVGGSIGVEAGGSRAR